MMTHFDYEARTGGGTVGAGYSLKESGKRLNPVITHRLPRQVEQTTLGGISQPPLIGQTAPFCRFFLETCLDQLDYMSGCLVPDTLERRLTGYAAMREATGDWPAGTGIVLRDVCLRGEIPRGDVPRLIGKSARPAQAFIRQLLDKGCLTSPSEKGPLRLGWPAEALPARLPGLFG